MALQEQSMGSSCDEFVLASLLIGTIVESFHGKSLLTKGFLETRLAIVVEGAVCS